MKFLKNILFILLFIFCGCSNLYHNLNWENSKKTMVNSKKLKIGDIIIKKEEFYLMVGLVIVLLLYLIIQ